jgi:hypothetical protein
MSHLPTVPHPGSNHQQQQRQQLPPLPPHPPSGPYDIGNWELRWRRRTTYDAKGRLLGTVVEEDATYTPPHLRQLQPPHRQRGGKGLLWLLVLFLLAPVAFPLIIFGLMLIGILVSLLQQLVLPIILVLIGLFVLRLLSRLLGRMPRRP